MPQRPTLDQLYGGGPAKAPSLDDLYGGLTAGGFDERYLRDLEKEFGLKTPDPYVHTRSADLPQSPLDLMLRPPPQITNAARAASDWITKPASDRGMVESYVRGGIGGALEGASNLLSPANVISTASGLGAARGTKQLGQAMDLVRGPGSYAVRDAAAQTIAPIQRGVSAMQTANAMTALPSLAHGGLGVMEDPTDAMSWAELAGGALGSYFGFKGGTMPPDRPPTMRPKPAEPLTPPTGKMVPSVAGPRYEPPVLEPPAGARPRMPWEPKGAARNVNQPLRPGLSLDEIYGPANAEPMLGSSSLQVQPPAPIEPPIGRFPQGNQIPTAQAAMENGQPIDSRLAEFFGITPEPPVGTGLSDVGQMDLGRRPAPGTVLPGEPAPPAPPGGGAGLWTGPGYTETPAPFRPSVPTAQEVVAGTGAGRPRMPPSSEVSAARGSMERGEAPPASISRFFGLNDAPGPVAAGAPDVMPSSAEIRAAREAMARGEQPPASLARFFGLDDAPISGARPAPEVPAVPEPPAPTIGRMPLDRLRELLSGQAGIGLTDELAPMRRMTGERIPPDIRQDVQNILDEMEMQPYMRGETIDTQAPGMEGVGGGRNWRDSSVTGGVGFDANPEHPNLIQHYPGAPVYHEIGGSQSRNKTIEAIQRMLNGGRATDLTDRVMDAAARRTAGRGPGKLEDVTGRSLLEPPASAAQLDAPEITPPAPELPAAGAGQPPPADMDFGFGANDPRIRQLYDELLPRWVKDAEQWNASVGIARDPMEGVEPFEDFARRLMSDEPRSLMGKERKLRAAIDSDAGFAGGDLAAALGGSLSGAAYGGAESDEHPIAGAIGGGLLGLLLGRGAAKALRGGGGRPPVPSRSLAGAGRSERPTLGTGQKTSPLARPAETGPSLEFMGDDGPFQLNASGESSASLEALSRQRGMQGRGEQFVVYDRAGQRRALIGPDAVDYTVRPGETYGVEQGGKFRKLDDAGGRYPGKSSFGDDAGFVEVPSAEDLRVGMEKGGNALERLGYFSMLGAPSTLAKGHIGAGAAGAMRALEEIVAGRPGTGLNIIKNMGSRRSAQAYKAALTEGSPDPTATRWGSTSGVLGTPSRIMAAPDAFVTESMLDAGIPLESAKRSAFTSDPRTATGNKVVDFQRSLGPIGRTVAFPFARTAVNLTEMGLERTPGLGLILEAFQKNPSAMRDILARQGLGVGAGVLGYSQGEDDGLMNPYALTAMGPYAVPAAIGAAIRGAVDKPKGTPSQSASTKALKDVAQGVLSQSPLPTEGYQLDRLLDPRTWPTRYIPRFLNLLGNPNEYVTPGIMDPTIARIPFLRDAMLAKKKKRGSGVTFSAPGGR